MRRSAWLTLLGLGLTLPTVHADDWPQWLGPQRDGVWREQGLLEKFPGGGPKVLWRTPVGVGYSGPAVANGRVYITDRVLQQGAKDPGSGFGRPRLAAKERVLCVDEKSGKILWTHEYDCTYELSYPAGPRTTPLVHGGNVYTLGAMGDLLCLDASSGKVVWSKNFPREYGCDVPQWGFSSHPLLDGDRLICLVGGPGSVVVAFHKDTGKELWRNLSAGEPGYAPAMIYEIGGKRQLIVWHPESVNGLDPQTGKVYWSQPFYNSWKKGSKQLGAGMSIASPRQYGDRLLVTAFYDGALMLKFDANAAKPTVVWKSKSRGETPDRTDGLHAVMATPVLKDGYIYGVCSYGELRCLKADTGERVWETHKPTRGDSTRWGNAFIMPYADRYLLFNELGELIIAKLTPKGYEEVSRAKILEPTNRMAGRPVVWSHPALANRCVYARNDREIVCVDMAAGTK